MVIKNLPFSFFMEKLDENKISAKTNDQPNFSLLLLLDILT